MQEVKELTKYNECCTLNEWVIIIMQTHVCFSFGFHYYAVYGLITISNIRSKMVSKNIKNFVVHVRINSVHRIKRRWVQIILINIFVV